MNTDIFYGFHVPPRVVGLIFGTVAVKEMKRLMREARTN